MLSGTFSFMLRFLLFDLLEFLHIRQRADELCITIMCTFKSELISVRCNFFKLSCSCTTFQMSHGNCKEQLHMHIGSESKEYNIIMQWYWVSTIIAGLLRLYTQSLLSRTAWLCTLVADISHNQLKHRLHFCCLLAVYALLWFVFRHINRLWIVNAPEM